MRIVRMAGFMVAALAAACAVAGCGTSADHARVRAATSAFLAALDVHHGAGACGLLNPSLAKAMEREQAVRRCSAAVVKTKTRGFAVDGVHVYATSARADLENGESVFLGLMRDGWRIDAFGCRPRPSGPYDCEEQG